MKHKSKTHRERNRSRFYKLITLLNPKSPISESYRVIRTNIQFAGVDREIRTLLYTSSGPAEGKTTTVSNMAIVTAQTGKKTLLIDADLRKPALHYTFRVGNTVGLTSILTGTVTLEEAIQKTEVENLSIITAGPLPPNPAELIGSNAMKRFIDEVKKRFDVILFDSPPLVAVTDAQILATLVDGVILVIYAGKTNRDPAMKARDLLHNVKANILGVVLNNKKMERDGYYYYYYGRTESR